jgi:hypothetical protein
VGFRRVRKRLFPPRGLAERLTRHGDAADVVADQLALAMVQSDAHLDSQVADAPPVSDG